MLKALWQTRLTETNTRDVEGVGRCRYENDGNVYRWVQNAEAAATDFTTGMVVYHKLSDGADMLKKVYKCLTANLGVMAGVVITDGTLYGGGDGSATATLKSFGWVQTLGYNATVSVSGATTGGTDIAAGDYMVGTTAVTHVIRNAATQPSYKRNIQILEAVATTTTPAAAAKKAYIFCM